MLGRSRQPAGNTSNPAKPREGGGEWPCAKKQVTRSCTGRRPKKKKKEKQTPVTDQRGKNALKGVPYFP